MLINLSIHSKHTDNGKSYLESWHAHTFSDLWPSCSWALVNCSHGTTQMKSMENLRTPKKPFHLKKMEWSQLTNKLVLLMAWSRAINTTIHRLVLITKCTNSTNGSIRWVWMRLPNPFVRARCTSIYFLVETFRLNVFWQVLKNGRHVISKRIIYFNGIIFRPDQSNIRNTYELLIKFSLCNGNRISIKLTEYLKYWPHLKVIFSNYYLC